MVNLRLFRRRLLFFISGTVSIMAPAHVGVIAGNLLHVGRCQVPISKLRRAQVQAWFSGGGPGSSA
ncbi:hypothetical protein [Hymenobacter sp. UYCo722]|uniref:hypothetical protein n=1 Tax=Hymenobacter sp. UYCo722 TaxID=3156335 RepID=UPI0033908E69